MINYHSRICPRRVPADFRLYKLCTKTTFPQESKRNRNEEKLITLKARIKCE